MRSHSASAARRHRRTRPKVSHTDDLIKEFESISKDLAAFSEMFDDAAARLTIVNAKLV